MIKDLVRKNRAYRRFDNSYKVSKDELLDLVDIARISSCGGNNQILRYAIFNEDNDLEKIFSHLSWAGFLKDWDGPVESERPRGYIFIYSLQKKPMADIDSGIASTNILLAATEMGLGGCIFKAFGKMEDDFSFDGLKLSLVLALGKPIENVVLVDVDEDGSTKYYRDEDMNHFVPKRKLEDVLLNK